MTISSTLLHHVMTPSAISPRQSVVQSPPCYDYIAAALLGFCTNIVHVNRAKSKWIRSAYSTCWCLLFVTVPQEISSPHIRSIDLCKYWSITSKQETIIYICGLQIYMAKKKEYKSAGTFSCTFAAGSPFPV